MRNIKIIISYDGSAYAGWQRQKGVPTIQECIEEGIGTMSREPVVLYGAGRTDAGVHALAMTANFKTRATIPCQGFLKGLNSLLPADIRILEVNDVHEDFHARFDATGKAYYYDFVITQVPVATERLYHAHLPHPHLDLAAMNTALKILEGEHDFTSFETKGSRDLTRAGGIGAVRTVHQAQVLAKEGTIGHFRVEIKGNGFLRHMVRNIVGTVFEVGTGRRTVAEFAAILQGRDRTKAGRTAPANGLFLQEVYY